MLVFYIFVWLFGIKHVILLFVCVSVNATFSCDPVSVAPRAPFVVGFEDLKSQDV